MEKQWTGLWVILVLIFCFANFLSAAFARESFEPFKTDVSGTGVPGYRVNHFTGDAVYEIPLDAFFAVHSLKPNLVLRYHPNNENSFTGYGWTLALGKVSRSHRLGLPRFNDTDIFVLSLPGIGIVDELVQIDSSRYTILYEKKNFYITKENINKWVFKDGAGLTYEFAKLIYSGRSEPKELAGFREVEETENPDNIRRVFTYKQDRPQRGFLSSMDMNSSLRRQEYTYESNTAVPYHNNLIRLNTIEDGRTIETNFTYDSYDNITKEVTTTNAAETITIETEFSPNTANWLVSLPYQEKISDQGNTYKTTQYLYDGGNASPSKGDITHIKRYLEGAGFIAAVNTYDSWGNPVTTTDPLGYTFTRVYDSSFHSFPVQITNPLLHAEKRDYWTTTAGAGKIRQLTDTNGNVTNYEYDGFGRLSKIIGPYDSGSAYGSVFYVHSLGGVNKNYTETFTTTEYGTAQNLYGKESQDGFGRTIETKSQAQDAKMVVVQTRYDARGNPIAVSVPNFDSPAQWFEHSYDALNRRKSTKNPDGTTKSYSYSNWDTIVTDENGRPRTFTKDSRWRTKEVRDASGTTKYEYDVFDNLMRITDALGYVSIFTNDTLGRRIAMTDPDLGSWAYTYDNNGNLIKSTNACAETINYTYDQLNRLISKDYASQSPGKTSGIEVTYKYDELSSSNGIGRRTNMLDLSGTSTWSYDKEGRVVKLEKKIDDTTYIVQWSYDAMDRVKTITFPTGKVITMNYNGPYINQISGYGSGINYDALANMTRVDYVNGLSTIRTYWDTDHRLKNISTTGQQDLSYNYDNVGNIIKITAAVSPYFFTRDYTYDNLDRLLSGGSTYDIMPLAISAG